MPSGLITGI